jgi:hypothetical protein
VEIPARILLPLAAAPLAASCFVFHCGPDNCREAVEGRTLYAPVLTAIEDYHREKAVYPEDLADLVPVFIEKIPISANEDGPKFPEYERTGDTFQFSFQYFGPGINVCRYSPGTEWSCDGHY